MTFQTDDDLRELFAPLAADEPSPAEISRLRRETARAPRRRPRRAMLAALAATTGAFAIALSLAPGGDDHDPQQGVLQAAAAVAADRPVPALADAPLRYAKVLRTFSYPAAPARGEAPRTAAEARRDAASGRLGRESHEQVVETWVGAKWRGREISQQGRSWVEGGEGATRELPADPLTQPRDSAYAYGDGPLAELDPADLPADRDAIARVLRDGIRFDRWGPYPESRGKDTGVPASAQASHVTYSIIGLLVYARLTAAQRAALLDVLATDPAAHDLGTLTDRRGREGRGVELTYADTTMGRGMRFGVIFDPETSEILEWSMSGTAPKPTHGAVASPDRRETVLAAGYATAVGERSAP